MASPFTAYLAGMGTVVAALAVGFSTAVMMTSPLPSEKEQPNGLQKRAEEKVEKPAEPARTPETPAAATIVAPDARASPLITAAQTPPSQTPAAWPVEQARTGQASGPKLAPDSGVIQQPVANAPAPAQPVAEPEKVSPPSSAQTASTPRPVRTREAVRNVETTGSLDRATDEWKKRERRDARKQQRRQPVERARPEPEDEENEIVIIERSPTTGYSSEPRSPLGILDVLTGGSR